MSLGAGAVGGDWCRSIIELWCRCWSFLETRAGAGVKPAPRGIDPDPEKIFLDIRSSDPDPIINLSDSDARVRILFFLKFGSRITDASQGPII